MWVVRGTPRTNDELIDKLIDEGRLHGPELEAAMRKVDRAAYTLAGTPPYQDSPQSIGYNATISAPHMHARVLELLLPALKRGKRRRALDVGAGSGYLTACMALLQGPGGLVVGVEHIAQLAEIARENLVRDQPDLVRDGRIRIVVGDGRLGFPSEAPFDAINVGAGATGEPKELEAQLALGGRMVVPVGPPGFQTLQLVTRSLDGVLHRQDKDWVMVVPLTDASHQWVTAVKPPPPPAPRRLSGIPGPVAATLLSKGHDAPGARAPTASSPGSSGFAPPTRKAPLATRKALVEVDSDDVETPPTQLTGGIPEESEAQAKSAAAGATPATAAATKPTPGAATSSAPGAAAASSPAPAAGSGAAIAKEKAKAPAHDDDDEEDDDSNDVSVESVPLESDATAKPMSLTPAPAPAPTVSRRRQSTNAAMLQRRRSSQVSRTGVNPARSRSSSATKKPR